MPFKRSFRSRSRRGPKSRTDWEVYNSDFTGGSTFLAPGNAAADWIIPPSGFVSSTFDDTIEEACVVQRVLCQYGAIGYDMAPGDNLIAMLGVIVCAADHATATVNLDFPLPIDDGTEDWLIRVMVGSNRNVKGIAGAIENNDGFSLGANSHFIETRSKRKLPDHYGLAWVLQSGVTSTVNMNVIMDFRALKKLP